MNGDVRDEGGNQQRNDPVPPIVSEQDESVKKQQPSDQQQQQRSSKPRNAAQQVLSFIRRFDTWDRDDVEVVFSSVVALASIVGIAGIAISSCLTLRSLEETQKATAAATQAVQAANRANAISRSGIDESSRLTREAINQNERLTGASIEESRKANQASNRAAKAAEDQIALERSNAMDTRRADLYVSGMALTKEPEEPTRTAEVTVTIRNNGLTAAKGVINRGSWGYAVGEPVRGRWTTIPAEHPAVLFPDKDYKVFVRLIDGEMKDSVTGKELSVRVRQAMIAAYRANKITMFVRLRTEYLDAFDRPRWVETCLFRNFNDPLNTFTFCDTGNDFSK